MLIRQTLSLLTLIFAHGMCSHHLNLYPVVEIEPLPLPPHTRMPDLTQRDVLTLVREAQAALKDRHQIFEPEIYQKGVRLNPNTPAWFMSISRTSLPTARNLTEVALIAEEATKYISQL